MRIKTISIKNFRCVEVLDLSLPGYYTALCGKNNAGKSTVLSALRQLLRYRSEPTFFDDDEDDDVSWANDYPVWKRKEAKKEEIAVKVTFGVDPNYDAGIHRFIRAIGKEPDSTGSEEMELVIEQKTVEKNVSTFVSYNGKSVSEYEASEIVKKLRAIGAVMYHDSTNTRLAFRYRYPAIFEHFESEEKEAFSKKRDALVKAMGSQVKRREKEVAELLGALQEKYSVSLSVPKLDFSHMPLSISLGDKDQSIPLADWGSGTRNRTLMLLTMFRAKQRADRQGDSDRIAPIVVVEEPESFLHWSAQAEFGRILQDMASEFKIQVLATTHSPYMLSHDRPESNILLRRGQPKSDQLRGAERVDTAGNDWKEPFQLALGIQGDELSNFRDLMFKPAESILLVEGESDVDYFTLLQQADHGDNRLQFIGEVYPYRGVDNLSNQVLLRFLVKRFKRVLICVDHDRLSCLVKAFKDLGLKEDKDYFGVGHNGVAGQDKIEGLLPARVHSKVYADHPELVQQQSAQSTGVRKSATNKLKKLCLDEFRATAKPGEDDYGQFYKLVKKINKALK